MPRFSDDFLQQLFETCDIEQVISPYTTLKRRGKNLVGLCPFHSEKTPSFTVYPESHSFFCFGCGAAGTAVNFVMRSENLDFSESVKVLCERFGLNMPQDSNYDNSLAQKRARMYEINKEAAKFFHSCLFSEEGKTGLEYYKSRGYSKATLNHFGMGYAPNDWRKLLNYMREKGYSYEELYAANLANKSEKNGKTNYYDSFRNRVMVPIIDVSGHVVAFGGRVLDDSKPKYINTSDTLVYKKSNGVFGLNFAKNSKEKTLILVEGYMDAISLHQAGFTNAIACLGTALTTEMAHLISRYCEEVILSYDADEAGQKATARAIDIFGAIGQRVRVVKLSGGKDPDEILKSYGPERYRSLLDGAGNDIEFELRKLREGIDLDSDDGKLRYLGLACSSLAKMNNTIAQDIYCSRLAEEFGVEKQTLSEKIKQLRRSNHFNKQRENRSNETREAVKNIQPSVASGSAGKIIKAQQRILVMLVHSPDFLKSFPELNESLFTDNSLKVIFNTLSRRIKENSSVELQYLSSELQPELLSMLTGLVKRNADLPVSKEEMRELTDTLSDDAKQATKIDVTALSDDEFRKLFNRE